MKKIRLWMCLVAIGIASLAMNEFRPINFVEAARDICPVVRSLVLDRQSSYTFENGDRCYWMRFRDHAEGKVYVVILLNTEVHFNHFTRHYRADFVELSTNYVPEFPR